MPERRVEVVITGSNRSREAFQVLQRDLRAVEPAAAGASGSLTNLFSNLGAGIGKLGQVGFAVYGLQQLKGAVEALGGALLGSSREFETYSVQFEVLLKSADAAKERMAELQKFNIATPFDLAEITKADKVLTGFGLHSVEAAKAFGYSGKEIRRIAADVAAGTGESMQSIAMYIGRFGQGLTGEAMMRFGELGAVTRSEMQKMGVEFNKAGELTSPVEKAMAALLKIMDDKFKGMSQRQSETFDGMLSNIRDWFGNTQREMMQPLFDHAKQGLQSFLDLLNSAETQNAAKRLGQGIKDAVYLDIIPSLSGAVVFVQELTRQWDELSKKQKAPPNPVADFFFGEGQGPKQGQSWQDRLMEGLGATPAAQRIKELTGGIGEARLALEAYGRSLDNEAAGMSHAAAQAEAAAWAEAKFAAQMRDGTGAAQSYDEKLKSLMSAHQANSNPTAIDLIRAAWNKASAAVDEYRTKQQYAMDVAGLQNFRAEESGGRTTVNPTFGGGPTWSPPVVGSSTTGKTPAERALEAIKEAASAARNELAKLKSGLEDVINAPLKGEGASKKRIGDLSEQIEALKLKQMELVAAKAPARDRVAVAREIAKLEKELKLAVQQAKVTFEPQRRAIAEATTAQRPEATAAQIIASATWLQSQINGRQLSANALDAAVRIAEANANAAEKNSVVVNFQNGSIVVEGNAPASFKDQVREAVRSATSEFTARLLDSVVRTQLPAPAGAPGNE